MPGFPYQIDTHAWSTDEDITADLLNRIPQGILGSDHLGGDISGITGTHTVCKIGGGSGPNIVYTDSRIVKVTGAGIFRHVGTGITSVTAILLWSGSPIASWYLDDLTDGSTHSFEAIGMVYPGAPGTASATLTLERAGAGTLTAVGDSCDLLVEDVGSTTHLNT